MSTATSGSEQVRNSCRYSRLAQKIQTREALVDEPRDQLQARDTTL
jgi:hypothetical protein